MAQAIASRTKMAEMPLTFSIARPVDYAKVHEKGIDSTRGPYGRFIQYRGTESERDKLQEAAAYLGITYGNFLRCIANDVAAPVTATTRLAISQQAFTASCWIGSISNMIVFLFALLS